MPIYAYKCSACGHAQDVLQKLSDPVLTVCPACGAASYAKQVTAAGFQLKGSGWYVTDFRGGAKDGAAKPDAGKPAEPGGEKAADKPLGEGAPAKAPEKAPEKSAATPAATPPAAPSGSGS